MDGKRGKSPAVIMGPRLKGIKRVKPMKNKKHDKLMCGSRSIELTLGAKILIIPIFKSGDKINCFNYRTIMIGPILANLYGILLEKKISAWLESHGKRDKG
jgi:hypothetical protein